MATAKKSIKGKTAKKPVAKAASKPVAHKTKVVRAAKHKSVKKVDYYPNRMTFWISAAAVLILMFLAILCVYNANA